MFPLERRVINCSNSERTQRTESRYKAKRPVTNKSKAQEDKGKSSKENKQKNTHDILQERRQRRADKHSAKHQPAGTDHQRTAAPQRNEGGYRKQSRSSQTNIDSFRHTKKESKINLGYPQNILTSTFSQQKLPQ